MNPRRYKYQVRGISLLRSVKYWLQGKGWNRKEATLVEVLLDSQEYKDAPFSDIPGGGIVLRVNLNVMPGFTRIL